MKKAIVFLLSVGIAACSSGLEGTYSDRFGMVKYTFQSGGIVTMESFGGIREFDYEVDDGKVKMDTPEGRMVMTIMENGNLSGPMGIELARIDQ